MSETRWFKALDPDELAEGRVKPVTCAHLTVCMTHHEGQYAALDNRCPHQGGPLGEGSIEKGLLRCPWHGWDYDPLTGIAPGYDDGVQTFPVEVREDGVYIQLEVDTTHEATVSDVMAETMTGWGVRWVFGMVGHSNLGFADAMRRQEEAGRLSYVAIRHEGAASFACSAYGKLTGRPAACFTIAGPGATNLLTGLWDANVDRSPVLALTGQVQTQVIGRGAFQEVDLKAAFGQVAQWHADVQITSDHPELMARAIKSAILHSGVSHLIFPDEVQEHPADGQVASTPDGRIFGMAAIPDPDQLEAAAARIRAARRPVIIVGHGARFHMDGIVALAEHVGAPVLTTFKGKGLIPDTHPLAAGVLGRSGTPIASHFMNEADLLIVLGSSFSNHTGISPKHPIVQVDLDPMALGKQHPIDVGVFGDIGQAVTVLTAMLEEGGLASSDPSGELAERWRIWRREKARRRTETHGRGLHAAVIFEALTRATPDDAVIAVDVGNNTYSFGRYFESRGQPVLMSGYLGSIGFALPAAMGAWAATQEEGAFEGRKVVSVSGDGGLAQYLAELTTLVRHDMDITHVVLNNRELGKISKEQRSAELPVWQTKMVDGHFAEIAQAIGIRSWHVTTDAELQEALEAAIAHDGPALVEIDQDPQLI